MSKSRKINKAYLRDVSARIATKEEGFKVAEAQLLARIEVLERYNKIMSRSIHKLEEDERKSALEITRLKEQVKDAQRISENLSSFAETLEGEKRNLQTKLTAAGKKIIALQAEIQRLQGIQSIEDAAIALKSELEK